MSQPSLGDENVRRVVQQGTDSESWSSHEQTSDQTQLSAKLLVEQAGSVELAKQAIQDLAVSQPSQSGLNPVAGIGLSSEEECPFTKALTKFERLLQTPIVSGDIVQWIGQAQQASGVVSALWDLNHRSTHQEAFESMIAQANDLSCQVEKLREEDKLLYEQELPKINHSLSALARQSAESETGPSGSEQKIDAVRKMAFDMVVRALTQETAISTWYMESLYRDSGSGD